jgi:hypothetical protein
VWFRNLESRRSKQHGFPFACTESTYTLTRTSINEQTVTTEATRVCEECKAANTPVRTGKTSPLLDTPATGSTCRSRSGFLCGCGSSADHHTLIVAVGQSAVNRHQLIALSSPAKRPVESPQRTLEAGCFLACSSPRHGSASCARPTSWPARRAVPIPCLSDAALFSLAHVASLPAPIRV